MQLKSLSLLNFKNYPSLDIEFSKGINCITGLNGEGKTNLLDAIHYLSFCKSFLNSSDSQNIYFDAPFFMIKGEFEIHGEDHIYNCSLKRGEKKSFKHDQKEYQKLSEHIGIVPLVLVSPSDAIIITGGSEERRRFLDSVISQFDKAYLQDLIQYNKVLQQRNAFLKQAAIARFLDSDTLDIIDEQLIIAGEPIYKKRVEFLETFVPVFDSHYSRISGGQEKAGIQLSSQLNEKSFRETLEASRQKDLQLEYSSAGIHKDDLDFVINGFSVKRFASMGQQKSLLLALKLAEHTFLRNIKKKDPILLLDDIYDRLDEERMGRLIELLATEKSGQIFITDTGASRIYRLFSGLDSDLKIFRVKNTEVEILDVTTLENA
jgi:DNA replication and repair protein RecF